MEKSHGAEKEISAGKATFSEPKISYESGRLPFDQLKVSEKDAQSRQKLKGDPIVSSGFVSYVKNGVNERGTLCTNLDAFPVATLLV